MREIKTPIATLFAAASDRGLTHLDYHRADIEAGNNQHLDLIERELALYFSGELTRFATPVDPIGTDFQRSVWLELQNIPYGETITYTQLAERLGNLSAIRAVAAANGANMLSIVIPCHRVIATNGDLQGYRGGLECKRFLLDHERGQADLF